MDGAPVAASSGKSRADIVARQREPTMAWQREPTTTFSRCEVTSARRKQPTTFLLKFGTALRGHALPATRSIALKRFNLIVVLMALLSHTTSSLHVPVDSHHLPWFWTPLMSQMGLSCNATLKIKLQTPTPSPNAYVMFFNEAQFRAVYAPYLMSKGRFQSSYLPAEWRASLAEPIDAMHRIKSDERGRYWLGIVQAMPKAVESLTGEVGFINNGGEELPVSQSNVSNTFLVVAWLFFFSAVLLLVLVILNRTGRSRLHGLILVTLLAKWAVLLLIHQDITSIKHTGVQSISAQVFWQLMRQLEMIMEVTLFYVIGLGWKVTRTYLRASEWAFASTVGVLSMFLGSFEVACNTFANCTGHSYLLTQFTLRSLCWLVVIVATNFNIFTLQRQITEALATPETGAYYTKYRAYCYFRGVFLFFVIIPSITNFLHLHVLSWDELWVIVFVREVSFWLVHSAVFFLFRPGTQHLRVFELAVVESSDNDSSDQE